VPKKKTIQGYNEKKTPFLKDQKEERMHNVSCTIIVNTSPLW